MCFSLEPSPSILVQAYFARTLALAYSRETTRAAGVYERGSLLFMRKTENTSLQAIPCSICAKLRYFTAVDSVLKCPLHNVHHYMQRTAR